jgi:PIN domain nuclease of toxin-antitoxin system
VGTSFCVLSVASIWEVTLKHRAGKLAVAPEPFRDGMREAGALILSITDVHVLGTAALEAAHRDPFDRLLVSVAQAERLTLLTADEALIKLAGAVPGLSVKGV